LNIAEMYSSLPQYRCWLNYEQFHDTADTSLEPYCRTIFVPSGFKVLQSAAAELSAAVKGAFRFSPRITERDDGACGIVLAVDEDSFPDGCDAFRISRSVDETRIYITGANENSVLYGAFEFIFALGCGKSADKIEMLSHTPNRIRIMQQWDNASGDIERGYAGNSIFYKDGKITSDFSRIRDYARLLASVGINYISLNNVNVHETETKFITPEYLPQIAAIASVFSEYGIRVMLSINFAAPIAVGGLSTADPLEESVQNWWRETADTIWSYIPDFGGFLVKADSEDRPGPYTYGRSHVDGANMLADAVAPHGGVVLWRCFVYNCRMDWRDRTRDRARAAYDNFMPLDGKFRSNVVLQIKNGPMDFQIREPVTPLFGGLEKTNQMIEFQVTQEYTGHQIDLCYLVPMWKEALDFDTFARGKGSRVSDIVSGKLFGSPLGGAAGVSNIGDSPAWTGNPLAQANLFGFGRLAWDPARTSEEIARSWAVLTFGRDSKVVETVTSMLLRSRDVYEHYTCPLGIGWFVNPQVHYGPSVDGYEYSCWGTYHYADLHGIGVDRTAATGTGYAAQYRQPNAEMYEHLETCPEELLLFFHHVPYSYRLKSGQTLLQYIYDSHFRGADEAEELKKDWESLRGRIDPQIFDEVEKRLTLQVQDAIEWRDVVNTYFYRKTGIPDEKGRKIYP
jgi:alpha-glucuronidase